MGSPRNRWRSALTFFALTNLAAAEPPPAKFKVTSLPGVKTLPNEMYTGYIDAGVPPSSVGKMYFHYWCVMSAGDATVDPVLFWYNGGPGASSLFGILLEFGPLLLTVDSYDAEYKRTGIPTPQGNQWAWTLNHTICAIDSPPPMGLSFCSEDGPGGSPTSCGPWSDTTVFAANHQAHKAFFEDIFPELKTNPFYFVGESYAGLYVPGFVDAMLEDPVPGLNFKGFAVGDGWPGCKPIPGRPVNWCINLDNVGVFKYPNAMPGPYWDLEFFHGNAQMSTELYTTIKKTCSEPELRGDVMPLSPPCVILMKQMEEEVGLFYVYNLYSACPTNTSKHGSNRAAQARDARRPATPGDGDGGVGSPCLGNAMADWIGLDETLKAIGAPEGTNFINLDNGHGFNYTTDRSFVGDVYVKAAKKGLRVMVYEGDTDACGLGTLPIEDIFVPMFNDLFEKKRHWHPWMLDGGRGIVGGYVQDWDDGRFMFGSLRGAGHMSPLNRPAAAFTLMTSFTQERDLPSLPPHPNDAVIV